MQREGRFKGWIQNRSYGFIAPDDGSGDVFLHQTALSRPMELRPGMHVRFRVEATSEGVRARDVTIISLGAEPTTRVATILHATIEEFPDREIYSLYDDARLMVDDVEELDTTEVTSDVLKEIAQWKREAKAEDNERYFWHVREADEIAKGARYFVIGRKGSGKTAICEYFNKQSRFDVFAEKLSFKNFPFNELYSQRNDRYTPPNQFITIWKYLIYSTVCRLLLRNEAIESSVREELSRLYSDDTPLSRRVGRWTGKEFGLSLFGLSIKVANAPPMETQPRNWTDHVDFLEDLLMRHAGAETYFVLFDELDEDYRDLVESDQYHQYSALITSLFKAVQDVRITFEGKRRIFPVIFLRDDIYELVQDNDKNKWGDARVDLNWDSEKIKRLVAFRISRAIDPACAESFPFELAWSKVFGRRPIGVGKGKKTVISTFEFISRSTLLRPRDFVTYLQNCAQYAIENRVNITPNVVKLVDKGFSNYLRQELTDELFAVLPDIAAIFDAISQLRKWNFSMRELQDAYRQQVENGFIKEKNVKFVLQVLYLFSVIGNTPRVGRYVFRYQNREARLNFNERVVVHRGLFKSLQIL